MPAERSFRVVSRDEVLDLALPDVTVEPSIITLHINQIRKVLGPAAIQAATRVGYCFSAKLDPAPDAALEPQSKPASPSLLLAGATPLIGRETELQELRDLIQNTRRARRRSRAR